MDENINFTNLFFNYVVSYTKKYFKAQLASVKTLVDQVSNDTSRCHYLLSLDCSVAAVYCLHLGGGGGVEQCLGEIYFRQKTIYRFGLFLRHVICTRPIYDLSQTNLDLDTFTTDL